jgi:hypothetical protein
MLLFIFSLGDLIDLVEGSSSGIVTVYNGKGYIRFTLIIAFAMRTE